MILHPNAALTLWLLAAPVGAQEVSSDAGAPGPVRMSTTAFGVTAEIEVRDLPLRGAEEVVEKALSEIYTISLLADPDGAVPGGVGTLNQAAGGGAQPVEARVAELLLRSLQFCIWSTGAYGPLGGELYELWSELEAKDERPTPSDLRRSVGSAECARLRLDNPDGGKTASAELAAGSRVDLRGIARGFAVDRAAVILENAGAQDFWVELDNVWRAKGNGPDGRGWLAVLPPQPGEDEPMDRIWLRDQALAIFSVLPLRGRERERDPLVDQRSGVPPRGVLTVVAVTRLAVDAEPLVSSLFVLGHRDGLMKLGVLSPRPSVLWILGQGTGTPLEASYRWSELDRIWRR